MIANALFCRQVAIWAADAPLPPGLRSRCTAMAHDGGKARAGWLDRGLIRALGPLPPRGPAG